VAVPKYDIGGQVLPEPWFVDNVHTYSILNQTRNGKILYCDLKRNQRFTSEYPRGQGKESNSPKETNLRIGFIRTDGKPSTI
jgi:hypothetical protein